MNLAKFSFVDIETTGTSFSSDRIIEIAVLRVEKNKIVEQFETLINPQTYVSPYIEALTGIQKQQLETAPLFNEISNNLRCLLTDTTFVAHNVRFDYSFVKAEFGNLGISFSSPKLCTVRLARHLFPGQPRYDLDSIIRNFQIEVEKRHRAMDDTRAMFAFFQKAQEISAQEQFEKALNYAAKKASYPIKISQKKIDSLPESPGVYVFYGGDKSDKDNTVLYVGKSVNIAERARSHFTQNEISTDFKICSTATNIDYIKTPGELGALIKEAQMVKDLQPIYNRKLRRQKRLTLALRKTNSEGYDTVVIDDMATISDEQIQDVLGIFRSKTQARKFLSEICKMHNLCPKLLGLENGKGKCMHYQFGWCKGACAGKEVAVAYNIRLLQAVSSTKIARWPFDGSIKIVEKDENQMQEFVVNNWCFINGENRNSFDLDTYRILRRYLAKKSNFKNIETL